MGFCCVGVSRRPPPLVGGGCSEGLGQSQRGQLAALCATERGLCSYDIRLDMVGYGRTRSDRIKKVRRTGGCSWIEGPVWGAGEEMDGAISGFDRGRVVSSEESSVVEMMSLSP